MPALEELAFAVEVWDGDLRPIEVLARTALIVLAFAAYEAALKARPRERIRVRHGARIVRDSGDAARR